MLINGFTLLRQLPSGRHGSIWQARDDVIGTEVAMKEIAGGDPAVLDDVGSVLDRLQGSSGAHRAGTRSPLLVDERIWLVEDWVDGISLAGVLGGSLGLSREQALGVLRGTLQALAAAHRADVVHGELSPRSIMINTAGEPVVIGFGAHTADPGVAAVDGFAGPEAFEGRPLAPTADVYAAGTMLIRMLPPEAMSSELRPVLERATADDPSTRHVDAGSLLADLESTAERAYGAGWWTTTGLSGLVASSMAAAAGTSGAAGTAVAGSGAISGTITAGDGALAGASRAATSGPGAVKGALRTAGGAGRRTALILAGTAVILVAVVVGAVAMLRPGNTGGTQGNTQVTDTGSNPGGKAGAGPSAATSPPAGPTRTPPPSPKPSPTPSPARPAAAQQGFTGTYRWLSVVTKSTTADRKVGSRSSATWTATTTCRGAVCTSKVDSSDAADPFDLQIGKGGWHVDQVDQAACVDTKTLKPTGKKVPMRYTRTLTPTTRDATGVTLVSGRDRYLQLKKCTNQRVPKYDVQTKITLTRIK